jgi:hypothetical protein
MGFGLGSRLNKGFNHSLLSGSGRFQTGVAVSLLTDAKKCVREHFTRLHPDLHVDQQGYVLEVKDNLVEGVDADLIKRDYENGSGQEWDRKIRAVHSSAALAANTFGFFKDKRDVLEHMGARGFSCPRLEAKCPSGLRGTPPNLDVLLESNQDVIGVESLSQYLTANNRFYAGLWYPMDPAGMPVHTF